MRVIFNGIEVTGEGVNGIDKVTIKHRRKDEDGKLSKSFSTELTVYGAGWEIVRDELINNPQGKMNHVDVSVYDTCCQGGTEEEPLLIFEGIIRGDTVDWCEGECFATVQLVEHTEETRKFDCVQSTLITDNSNGFMDQTHPRFRYCNELRPSGLQDVILILGIIVNLIIVLLYPLWWSIAQIVAKINAIIWVLNLVIDAVNTLPLVDIGNISYLTLDQDDQTSTWEEIQNLIEQLNERLVGCGRAHPSPLVRRYIENACDICGIGFESSIFTDPSSDYYNTAYFHAPVEKGTRDNDVTMIEDNYPIKTLEGFLTDLKPVFQADYRVEGNVLKFEREDAFWDGTPWLNYAELSAAGKITSKLCYSWRDEELPAFGQFEYSDDPVDWVGNEAKERYSDTVEFNQPFNELQKGSREIFFPFGMARHRGDAIDRDVLGDYDWWPTYQNILQAYEGVLIMNSGVAFNPKLLIWDGVSNSNAKVRRFSTFNDNVPQNEAFNAPYWLHEWGLSPNAAYPQDHPEGSLYARFHSWKHPRVIPDRGLQFTFAFKFDCDELRDLDAYGTVTLPAGAGRISEIEVDYESRTMTITGNV